ncbi:MAG: aminopeptidase [Massiliimalia sp.]|jgi:aminopeptidase
MKQFEENLKKYAALVIRSGVNLQKDQLLVIRAPIESAPFVRMLTKEAYTVGAKDVAVFWKDEQISKMRYLYSPMELFETMPAWQAEFNNHYAREGAAFITIAADDPDLLEGVDPQKLIASVKASHLACTDFYENIDNGNLSWNIISVPTPAWAKKIFPDCDEQQAQEKLWEAIFHAVRVDTPDPIEAWKQHSELLQEKSSWLNSMQFEKLHYTNSLGTDLMIGLPENHIWEGGGGKTNGGVFYFANMPTEEVFTAPHREKVNGIVYSALPLNHNGSLISEFSLTFQDGKVIDFTAKQGYDVLKHVLDTDEGSRYLGEVALVPYDSPVSNMGILFYNTLFDENASCHLALGSAYQSCIEGGLNLSKEELLAKGINDSDNHIDFMIGTKDLTITGITKDGKEIPVFKDGNWA